MKMEKMTDPGRMPLSLGPILIDLVKLRIAQMHQCRWYVHELAGKLKKNGEMKQRLTQLKDWRRMSIFSDREEAALNLAEALIENPIEKVPREIFQAARLFFKHDEMICLIMVILTMNDWFYFYGKECLQAG